MVETSEWHTFPLAMWPGRQAIKGTTALPLAQALARHPGLLIDSSDVDAYRRIDPANGRMRALAADTPSGMTSRASSTITNFLTEAVRMD